MYFELVREQERLRELAHHADESAVEVLEKQYTQIYNEINSKDIADIDKNTSCLFFFHNHNLAYYCWKKLFLEGKLGEGNLLLHFDSHRDFDVPDAHQKNMFMQYASGKISLREYCLTHLWITDYMYPAVTEGLINEIIWVEPDHLKLGIGPQLLPKTFFDIGQGGFTSRKGVPLTPLHLADIIVPSFKKEVILNIDYDYFSCRAEPKYVATHAEITDSIQKLSRFISSIRSKTVTVSISPDYVPLEQIDFIDSNLRKALEKS
ncbi:MAG TPA: UPF0489 family protein [Candidatus Nanoarchaeia archaeon]|nr:UPF0489 family protein [Candidatus Nanoarchaeia archaeon]